MQLPAGGAIKKSVREVGPREGVLGQDGQGESDRETQYGSPNTLAELFGQVGLLVLLATLADKCWAGRRSEADLDSGDEDNVDSSNKPPLAPAAAAAAAVKNMITGCALHCSNTS